MSKSVLWVAAAAIALLACDGVGAAEGVASKIKQLPLRYKDANGRLVGRVLWAKTSYVAMTVAGTSFVTEVRSYLAGGVADYLKADFSRGKIYFTDKDCTGQAYMSLNDTLFGIAPAVVQSTKDGRILAFVASSGIVDALVPTQSVRSEQFDCQVDNNADYWLPVSPVGIDLSGFVPPFTVQ